MRADAYVMGQLTGPERERAERELETSAEFREAVLAAAQRVGFGAGGRAQPDARWAAIAERLASMPHMTGITVVREPVAPPPGRETRAHRWLRAALDTLQTALRLFRLGAGR